MVCRLTLLVVLCRNMKLQLFFFLEFWFEACCFNLPSYTISINGVVVTWVVAIDPPGVRFPLNAGIFFCF